MICCGLIEAGRRHPCGGRAAPPFSAVICCGLIEASGRLQLINTFIMFSAVICCGLIEAIVMVRVRDGVRVVFRSDMLRPH